MKSTLEYHTAAAKFAPKTVKLELMVLGLLGEWGEFLVTPTLDELGDVFWYLINCPGFPLSPTDVTTIAEARKALYAEYDIADIEPLASNELFELCQRVYKISARGKEDNLSQLYLSILQRLYVIADMLNFSIPVVWQYNIDKLSKRWPNGVPFK